MVPPRAIYLRADGRARAPCQSFRRHRRHLQRRVIFHHARTVRHPARAGLARGRSCFGHRLMMDCVVPGGVAHDLGAVAGRSFQRCWTRSGGYSHSSSTFTTIPPRCRTAPPQPAFCAASWRGNSAPAAMSDAPAAAPSMRAGCPATRPTTGSPSRSRCLRPATSMRACGYAFARSSKASR